MRINPEYQTNRSSMESDNAPDADYINALVKHTKSFFINKSGIPPVFIYHKDNDIKLIQVPVELLESSEGKDEMSELIGGVVATISPDSYCFVSESWIYKMQNFESTEAAMQAVADFKKGIPSDNIKREETVTFAFTQLNPDKSADRWLGTLPFFRDVSDKISSFGSILWVKEDSDKKFEGRLVF